MRIGASEYYYTSVTSVDVIARKNKEDPGHRYTLHVDEPCVIQPVEPTNQRNRGRECIVRYFKSGKATVEFLDGKGHRFVRVPLCDVVPKKFEDKQVE